MVTIYPNPANERVSLNTGDAISGDLTLEIYDIVGTLVKSEILKAGIRQIFTGDLESGIYMLTIRLENMTINKKLIIQN